ncbi:MAG TPA: tRNA (guanosine(37)-N1)-methyltransferase TrmD [Spirochaetota bacterium]|nr:tRNA (guanosine(37)-N1)-methyltransferase TrmD [Spirochaetota bacterium]
MKCRIITLFPEFFASPLSTGLMGKAVTSGILDVDIIDLRAYSDDRHRRCDDYTYGGGSGMVLKPEPLFRAIDDTAGDATTVVLTSPSGKVLDQEMVKRLYETKDICIVCGNYEGVDHRVVESRVDYEVSLGDYIISGGEFAALVILDAVARYAPGFMSNSESLLDESFENGLLEYPHYTRPEVCEGMAVPEVLLSGDHKKIDLWRHAGSIDKTRSIRPDLYKEYLIRKIRGE